MKQQIKNGIIFGLTTGIVFTLFGVVYAAWNDVVSNGDTVSASSWNTLVGKVGEIDDAVFNQTGNFQEANGASISLPNNVTTEALSLTVDEQGDYLVLGKAETQVPSGYTYHVSICTLTKNAIGIDSSAYYVGTVNGGSSSYYPHKLSTYESLNAGDILTVECVIVTNNAPGSINWSKIEIIPIKS